MGRGAGRANRGLGQFEVLTLVGETGEGLRLWPDPAVNAALAVMLALEPATEYCVAGTTAATLSVEHSNVGCRFPFPRHLPLFDLGIDRSLFGCVVLALCELFAAFFYKGPVLDGAERFLEKGLQVIKAGIEARIGV